MADESATRARRMPRTLPEILEAYERIIIIKAIQACGGSRTRAAVSLGVRRRYLYARISYLGIDLGVLPVRQGRPRGASPNNMRDEEAS
jgi:DNA-binding NtrC family response regulator